MKTKALLVLAGVLLGASLGGCARSQGEINTQAIETNTQAVETNAQAIEHYNRGLENQEQGQFDLAIEEYAQAIALDPQYADPYNNRGVAYASKGDLDQAIANYDRAIALDPQYADPYNNRGVAYASKGDLDRAIADYDRAIAIDPQYVDPYNNRGNAYVAKGDPDRAIADFDQAIALDPQLALAYTNRGNAYYAKGDLDRAIADYDQATALDPEYADAYYNRGIAYGAKGDLDRAIVDYDQAIALDPQFVLAYLNRGNTYDIIGEFDQAIPDYDQAIALDPEFPKLYFNRGIAYLGNGEFDRAIADFDQAIALDPEYGDAYYNRGFVYFFGGNHDQVLADLDKAIELDPGSARAYYMRGIVHSEIGERERAISDIEKSIELGLDAETKQFAEEKLEGLRQTAPETLVTIVARCRATPPTEDWSCNNLLFGVAAVNADLEAAGDSRRVVVETIQDNTGFGDIMQEFALAYEHGQAPDIVLTGHEFIGTEATAGRIISIESMIGDYPEFANMIDRLWASVTFKGERWGIPQGTEARPIYWDKNLLARVPGWDAARADRLADEILAGNFTLGDMLDTAEAAVGAGVVAPGKGYWMRPLKGIDFTAVYYAFGGETIDADTGTLVYDTAAGLKFYQFFERGLTGDGAHSFLTGDWGGSFHPNVSGGNVLFWAGGSWQWAEWANKWTVNRGGEDYQFENWGYGLYPAGEAGGSPGTLSHPLAYLISAQTEHPDLALALIAKATTDEANTRHVIISNHLGILTTQASFEPYTKDIFRSDVLYMLDYTNFVPNNPNWRTYDQATFDALARVQAGELTALEAVFLVVATLQIQLGDDIIVLE